jgi:hypothetical protein
MRCVSKCFYFSVFLRDCRVKVTPSAFEFQYLAAQPCVMLDMNAVGTIDVTAMNVKVLCTQCVSVCFLSFAQ